MNKVFLVFTIALATNFAFAADVSLQCTMGGGGITNLEASTPTKKAKLIIGDEVVDGVLDTTEHHYLLSFPRTTKRYETHISVNRLTGEFTWEHGQPPFGKDNIKNHKRTGLCSKRETEKL